MRIVETAMALQNFICAHFIGFAWKCTNDITYILAHDREKEAVSEVDPPNISINLLHHTIWKCFTRNAHDTKAAAAAAAQV